MNGLSPSRTDCARAYPSCERRRKYGYWMEAHKRDVVGSENTVVEMATVRGNSTSILCLGFC